MLAYITEPHTLHNSPHDPELIIVDVGTDEQYGQGHVPGAVHLDYGKLRAQDSTTPGVLPSVEQLQSAYDEIGLSGKSHIIAYDHENNAKACRLLWTLEACSQFHHSLLNGGITAWSCDGYALETERNTRTAGDFRIKTNPSVVATRDDVLHALDDPSVQILDSRSRDEYMGRKSASKRKGHIPGAIHLDWLDTIDKDNSRRLRTPEQLDQLLDERGVRRDREIIVHCQTHQRSSHSFVMLRSMGFERVRGYGGSWSEWGNDLTLPIVTEDQLANRD